MMAQLFITTHNHILSHVLKIHAEAEDVAAAEELAGRVQTVVASLTLVGGACALRVLGHRRACVRAHVTMLCVVWCLVLAPWNPLG